MRPSSGQELKEATARMILKPILTRFRKNGCKQVWAKIRRGRHPSCVKIGRQTLSISEDLLHSFKDGGAALHFDLMNQLVGIQPSSGEDSYRIRKHGRFGYFECKRFLDYLRIKEGLYAAQWDPETAMVLFRYR